MDKPKKKLSKTKIAVISVSATAVLIAVILLILNSFFPLKYASAYCVSEDEDSFYSRVTYVDAGFGDCAFIELPDGKVMLIDGGDGTYSQVLEILKLLNRRGKECIDYLICTSVKEEHCGGFAEILKYKSVGTAFIPYCKNTHITRQFYNFTQALEKSGAKCRYACADEGVADVDNGYFFTFLSPSNYKSADSQYAVMNAYPTESNIDNASAIVYLECAGVRFVFTSDARSETLSAVVSEYNFCKEQNIPFRSIGGRSPVLEDCDFVTVPLHGGENGKCAVWYGLLKPKNAIVSVGKNYAGCPSSLALSDVYATADPIYTKYSGNITVTAEKGVYSVIKEKE